MNFATDFAGIAAGISTAFGGPYHAATVYRRGAVTLDSGGSVVPTSAPSGTACLVQVDGATEAMRLAEGFTDADVRLLVLNLAGGLDTDAEIEVIGGPRAGRYSLQSVTRDTGGFGWDCRGRPA